MSALKKVLFVATVVKNHIMQFHIPYLKMFKDEGWETAVAARNDYEDKADCAIPHCDKYFDIPFERMPLKRENIRAYRQLKEIIDREGYDIIHCHTPVGALLARLAAIRARRNGTRVIYTAHGFHFYKGAPALNWMLYFPAEWICAFFTDTLITINKEDCEFAKKHLHAKHIEYVKGVGVDLHRFNASGEDREKLRRELGIPDDKLWVLNVGELIKRKNQEALIRAAADMPEVYLTIAGRGKLKQYLESRIAELGVEDRVKLLGYRSDVSALCQASDVFAFPSFQEGLSVALMEAMACGKPIACSAIRGNTDLIDSTGGELFDPKSIDGIRAALASIIGRDRDEMGRYNAEKVKEYSLEKVSAEMMKIYFN